MLSVNYLTAMGLAFKHHQTQERKDSGIPYISHLLSVSALVMEFGGTEEQAIAGLLHDVLEDSKDPNAEQDIYINFGPSMVDLVKELSDTTIQPKPPWKERKEAYMEHLRNDVSDTALLVSMCDKLHNLRSIIFDYKRIGDEIFEKFRGKKEGTLWYYRTLTDIFKERNKSTNLKINLLIQELENLLDWFYLD